MLKRLHLQNFTVFADADFQFEKGLNVIVGTNGTGKSHVLKVGYASLKTADRFEELPGFKLVWNENNLKNCLREELISVFRPELNNLGHLIRWQVPQSETSVKVVFDDLPSQFRFDIVKVNVPEYALQTSELSEQPAPNVAGPVFIPAKEVLTLSWISRLDERYRLPIDGTYLDLFSRLRPLALRSPEKAAAEALITLEELIGGTVEQSGDNFYLVSKSVGRVEMNMVAEGIRKFGTLSQLLANGSLNSQSVLFWDEPEANLNPALLRQLAAILAELARQGFQIILATHSMSLLKEFHILSREPNKEKEKLPIKYFGLNARPGQATTVISRDNFEYLPDVVALDVELEQADKLEEVFIRDDQEFHADNR